MHESGMEQSVRDSLASVKDAQYQGAVDLAVSYGRLLDQAAAISAEVEHLDGDLFGRDVDARRRLERVEKLVAGHAAFSDLGPKLLAALTALGATPAAVKDVKGGGTVVPISSPLQAARDRARANRAATVDAPAS